MQLIFTKDIGRWKAGQIVDYHITTWKTIAQQLKKPLESFTKPVEAAAHQLVTSKTK